MKALRLAAGIVLALGALVALILWLSGGLDTHVFGLRITLHDPWRIVYVGVGALALYVIAGGRPSHVAAAAVTLSRIDPRWAAASLALLVCLMGIAFGTMTVGGSDSYGYVSEAEMLRSGRLTLPQPWVEPVPWPSKRWTFTPLGYRPIEADGRWDISPGYALGLPLLMAAAGTIGGYRAVFFVVPICGAILVLATFGIGRRLGSSRTGLLGAWFVATSPTVLFMVVAPMSDVPAAALWALATWFVLSPRLDAALAGGVCAALAILVRPNIFFLAGILGLWYGVCAWRDRRAAGAWLLRATAFAAPVVAASVAVAWLNAYYHGGVLGNAYGKLEDMFSLGHVAPNLRNYFGWLIETQTPLVLIGLAALLVPMRRVWPGVPDRRIFAIFGLFVAAALAEYCGYFVFDAWWYLRFLLPIWPLLMLGLGAVAVVGLRSRRRWLVIATAAVVALLGARGVWVAETRSTFQLWKGDRKSVTVATLVRERTDGHSVVFAMQHSGSLRFYGGRLTARFDQVNEEWLDRAVAWFVDHGVHPYALLEDWEIPIVQDRYRAAGQVTLTAFDAPPVFRYRGPAIIYFFDLLRPVGSFAPVETVVETYQGPRCVPPMPLPSLLLSR